MAPFFKSTADGMLYLTALDVAKWDAALYTEKLLKRSTLDEMWTIAKLNTGAPNSDNHGLGWFINLTNGHRVIEHSGFSWGYTAHFARYVDDTSPSSCSRISERPM